MCVSIDVHMCVSIGVCTYALYVHVHTCTCLLMLSLHNGCPTHIREEFAQIPLNHTLTHTMHMRLAGYVLHPTYKVFIRKGPGPKRIYIVGHGQPHYMICDMHLQLQWILSNAKSHHICG